jgi:UrcA family protein
MNCRNFTRRRPLLGLTLAVSGLLAAGAAFAADQADGTQTRQLTIRYHDVDMSTPDGAMALYGRISRAARLVCGERGRSLAEQSDWQRCEQAAIAGAVQRIDNPLLTTIYREHQGATPFTAMLSR